MNNPEIVLLVNKALADNVAHSADTFKLMGEVNSYFQKAVLISVFRKVCPDKDLTLEVVVK